jgi:cytoskeletal protein CcmA (bactofilin family)
VFNRRKPEEPKIEDQAPLPPPQPEYPLPPEPLFTNPPPDFLAQPQAAPPPSAQPDHAGDGLGVPPYRPQGSGLAPYQLASLKENSSMARSPFAPPLPPVPPSGGLRPASDRPLAPREDGQRRTLVVGRGISVQGTVQDAERLVVEGTMEATMINGLTELSITHGGIFKGEVEVDEAEVAGTIDGTLTARNALIIRASGRVLGTARCRRLQVEDGGQITGRIEMLGDTMPAPAPTHAPAPAYAPAYEGK